jgi:outer membrane protein assembly factor BamE
MLTLSGCFIVHKNDIEQGNIITADMVSLLKPGMTEVEVRNIMGNAVLVNIFSPDRIDYIYTLQKGHSARMSERVICIFYQGRLKEIIKYSR